MEIQEITQHLQGLHQKEAILHLVGQAVLETKVTQLQVDRKVLGAEVIQLQADPVILVAVADHQVLRQEVDHQVLPEVNDRLN